MECQNSDLSSTLIIGDRFARAHAPEAVLLINQSATRIVCG